MFGGGWVTELEQGNYGHKARKRTWLFACGLENPPALRWGTSSARAWVGWGNYDKYPDVPRIARKESSATPLEFRDQLLEIARASSTGTIR